MRPLAVVATLTCLAAAPHALGLDPSRPLDQYSHAAWQVEQGLPQNTVQAIRQTRDGFLWIGTVEGLARFDGDRFLAFGAADVPALGAADVQFLHEDRAGRVWIGVYGVGLVVHDAAGFRRVPDPQGGALSGVVAMAEAVDGTLWVGGEEGVLFRVVDGVAQAAEADRSASIRALAFDARGRLWIATTAGLGRREGGRTRWLTRRDGLASDQVSALVVDGEALWLGTAGGVQRLAGDALQPPVSSGAVRALLLDRQGSLWVGHDHGLVRVVAGVAGPTLGAEVLSDDSVRALAEDRDGSLWVGTFAGGLNQLKDGTVRTYTRAHGLPGDDVGVAAPARDGAVWVAGEHGSVARIQGDSVRVLPTLPGRSGAWALHEDRSGRLWAGIERGLARFDAGRWRLLGAADGVVDAGVIALHVDGAGRVWLAQDGIGVTRLEGGRAVRLSTSEGLPSDQIRAFLEARDGRLWIATYGGLVGLEGDRIATTYTTRDGLSSNFVRALHEDAEGVLWIGTYGGGLTRLKQGRLAAITAAHGLFSNVVYAVVEDAHGSLWMSCNRGVFAVAKRDLDAVAEGRAARVTPRVYGRSDGMLSIECNGGTPAGARSADGRLWFPTVRGLVSLDPLAPQQPLAPPEPVLEDVRVDGVTQAARPVNVRAGARRVRFEFTAPDFLAPDRLKYEHRLAGFDEEWLATPRRAAEYTSLPPGDYRFEVRVTDAAGRRGELAVPVVVAARFWQTRPFSLFAGLAVLAVLYGGYGLRVRALRAREAELQRRVDAALADVRVLSGLLPICSNCKKIRDDRGYWGQIESYIHEHSEAEFTHGICPDCAAELYPGLKATARAAGPEEPGQS